ncbi:MAG: alpha/beta hydrolase family protein [Janthinobacterium lividum]
MIKKVIPRIAAHVGGMHLVVLAMLVLASTAFAAPQPTPVDPHFYDYDAKAPFAVTQTVDTKTMAEVGGGIQVLRVTYPSPVVTPYPVNNLVTGFLFLPSTPGPHPVMLVEHEWLPVELSNEFVLCASLARGGVAAFLVVQPYSYNRRILPRVEDVELLSGDTHQTVAAVRQAVLDNRRALDWLQSRPDIDPTRMGVAGISLGGILAPLIAGVDHRARVLVTIVGGADVSDLVYDSFITYGLRPSLLYHGVTFDSIKRDYAPIEPTNWLAGLDPKNALLFNGRFDVFVNPKQAHHLANALGGAPIVWINTGHYGTVFAEKRIEAIGVRFVRSRFGLDNTPFTAPKSLPAPTIKIGLLFGGQEGVSPVVAYQAITVGPGARYSLDGQLTTHGLAIAPSFRLDESNSIGLEVPLLHGKPRTRFFYSFSFVL